jgi:hypothetical protein
MANNNLYTHYVFTTTVGCKYAIACQSKTDGLVIFFHNKKTRQPNIIVAVPLYTCGMPMAFHRRVFQPQNQTLHTHPQSTLGKPMSAVRCFFSRPNLIFLDINTTDVSFYVQWNFSPSWLKYPCQYLPVCEYEYSHRQFYAFRVSRATLPFCRTRNQDIK